MTIEEIVAKQRAFYLSGATRSFEFRQKALRKLQSALRENEDKIAGTLLRTWASVF